LEINNLGVGPKKFPTNLSFSQLSTTCSADVAPQATLQKWEKKHCSRYTRKLGPVLHKSVRYIMLLYDP